MEFKSITKSTYIEEGLAALRLAKTVNTVEELMDRYDINQNSDYSRKTCWGQIKKRYLDINKNIISHTSFLKLIDYADEKLNKELMYYKYIHQESLARESILKFFYPRLLSGGNYLVEREDVLLFIRKYIQNYSEATIVKTANSIIKALVDFGIASDKDNKVCIEFYNPSLYMFLYALYAEYSHGYDLGNNFRILNPSLEHIRKKSQFYKLFFIKPALLETYLKMAWEKGFLDYEPRGGLNQYVLKFESLDGYVGSLLEVNSYE